MTSLKAQIRISVYVYEVPTLGKVEHHPVQALVKWNVMKCHTSRRLIINEKWMERETMDLLKMMHWKRNFRSNM